MSENEATPAPQATPALDMALTAPERQEIQDALQKLQQAKLQHSDVVRQNAKLTARKADLEAAIDQIESGLQDRINGMAKSRGADGKTDGWFLNFDNFTFSKTK